MKNKRKILVGAAMVCSMLFVMSCRKTQAIDSSVKEVLTIEKEDQALNFGEKIAADCPSNAIDPAPIISGANLLENVSYNNLYPETKFDIYIPTSANALNLVPLVIFVHGGGFRCGDKSDIYELGSTFNTDIKYYIDNGIAVATINYRLEEDFRLPDGTFSLPKVDRVRTSIKDVQRCLQFIRYNASTYKIKKAKIGMLGSSAGGGASIYLAFTDDMKISGATDLTKESTRLQAVGHNNSQATYSPYHLNQIFQSYACPTAISPPYTIVNDLNFIGLITSDDPKIYIRQDNAIVPCSALTQNDIAHNAYQAKALYDAAAAVVPSKIILGNSEITAFGITPTVSMREFMKNRLQ
jgi:Carboxylesterase family